MKNVIQIIEEAGGLPKSSYLPIETSRGCA